MDVNVVWRLKEAEGRSGDGSVCLFLFNGLHKSLICCNPHIQIEILQCRDTPKWCWVLAN